MENAGRKGKRGEKSTSTQGNEHANNSSHDQTVVEKGAADVGIDEDGESHTNEDDLVLVNTDGKEEEKNTRKDDESEHVHEMEKIKCRNELTCNVDKNLGDLTYED
jgi:hypothetical protein